MSMCAYACVCVCNIIFLFILSHVSIIVFVQAQFTHPNVVGLVGVVTVGEPLMIVIEVQCEHHVF
jgi:hypothetical protein